MGSRISKWKKRAYNASSSPNQYALMNKMIDEVSLIMRPMGGIVQIAMAVEIRALKGETKMWAKICRIEIVTEMIFFLDKMATREAKIEIKIIIGDSVIKIKRTIKPTPPSSVPGLTKCLRPKMPHNDASLLASLAMVPISSEIAQQPILLRENASWKKGEQDVTNKTMEDLKNVLKVEPTLQEPKSQNLHNLQLQIMLPGLQLQATNCLQLTELQSPESDL